MTTDNYPLADGKGAAIPFHVLRPISLGRIDFTGTPTAVINIGVAGDVAVLYSSADCLVRFGAAVSVPTTGTELSNTLYIPSGYLTSIQYPATGLSVVQISEAGTLWIQRYTRWQLIRSNLADARR